MAVKALWVTETRVWTGWGGAFERKSKNLDVVTFMEDFEEEAGLEELWEAEKMLGKLSNPEAFRRANLFFLSDTSSFMTGSALAIDGGYTAW